jgi:hypothetical protein
MSLIDSLNSILSTLKTDIKLVLSNYTVKYFMVDPTRTDQYPFCAIVPYNVTPLYDTIPQENEYGIFDIHLYIVVRTPFDHEATTLLEDLDTLITKLKSIRHDNTKWRNLDYSGGVKFSYDRIENSMLQSADIALRIKK